MCVNMREGFEVDNISEADRLKMRIGYFACVSYLDEILGDLLTRLELSGDLKNTIIVYSSDHGEMAGEHGSWWKQSFHEASARVPMIISLPEHRNGKLAAQRLDRPVSLIDLFPTFCDFAGAEIPMDLDGISLRSATELGVEPKSRPVVCDNLIPRWGKGSEFRMVRYEQYKYIAFRDGSELFFDLSTDPLEQSDLCRRGMKESAQSALLEIRGFVKRTMDFDAAEQERIEGTERLADAYPLMGVPNTGNLYHLRDGRIVNGEEVVYNPTVIANGPETIAGQDWQEQNTVGSKATVEVASNE